MEELRKNLEEITSKYGYFVGLAYDDDKVDLAVYEKGEVINQIMQLIASHTAKEVDNELLRVETCSGGVEPYSKSFANPELTQYINNRRKELLALKDKASRGGSDNGQT